MRLLLAAVACCLPQIALPASSWEIYFPEEPPAYDERPLLSINVDSGFLPLIGSQGGYVLVASGFTGAWTIPFRYGEPTVTKTPANFDLTAIEFIPGSSSFVFGGLHGEIAVYELNEPVSLDHSLEDGTWRFSQLPIDAEIETLLALEDTLFAHADRRLFLSQDNGITWRQSGPDGDVFCVQDYKGRIYAMSGSEKGAYGRYSTASVHASSDGLNWKELWHITDTNRGFTPYPNLVAIIEEYDGVVQNNLDPTSRLYAFGGFSDAMGSVVSNFAVSTTDGEIWLDHGSSTTVRCPVIYGCTSPWNPLELPDAFRFLPRSIEPDFIKMHHNYRFGLRNRIEYFDKGEWLPIIRTDVRDQFLGDLITQWDQTLFLDLRRGLFLTSKPGTSPIPVALPEGFDPDQTVYLETVAGITYFMGQSEDGATHTVLATEDLINWEELYSGGRENVRSLVKYGNELLRIADDGLFRLSDGTRLFGQLDPYVEKRKRRYTDHPGFDALFALKSERDAIVVVQMSPDGSRTEFARTNVESSPGYFNTIDCLDKERLIAYGYSAEIAIIEKDGTVRLAHPWNFFPPDQYYISKIRYINGWYYILGGTALRTRDFTIYEPVELPRGQKLIDVVGQDGILLGFTRNAVYRSPLERGYLGSIEHQQGWRQSDWLGWFQIRNEAAGEITHLLLGDTTVTKIHDTAYQLATATLGPLKVRTDWMPWMEREADGHWLWLDQDGWPPRTWDGDAEAWIEMNP